MSFVMMKKKKFKFLVNFVLEDLSSIPYVSGTIFAKIRLMDGGNFTKLTQKEEIQNHCVHWKTRVQFQCKMTANPTSGVLDNCLCRVSIRKETKGGKSYQKLGYADLNLSEFAGGGPITRRYLLNGYDTEHRQDNSMIRVIIEMSLLSGDPCFKVPTSSHTTISGSDVLEDLTLDNKGLAEDVSGSSCASGSSGFNSLSRKDKTNPVQSAEHKEPCDTSHSRNPSEGYGSLHAVHSRQGSTGTEHFLQGHIRNASSGSGTSDQWRSTAERRRKLESDTAKERRVDSTRVDADELIEELVKGTDFQADDSGEISGLQLYVNKDGTASLHAGQEVKGHLTSGVFRPIVFNPR